VTRQDAILANQALASEAAASPGAATDAAGAAAAAAARPSRGSGPARGFAQVSKGLRTIYVRGQLAAVPRRGLICSTACSDMGGMH
jgi:hypothetical protein